VSDRGPPTVIAEQLWQAALDDSGLSAQDVHRFEAEAREDGAGAQWWAPGLSIDVAAIQRLLLTESDARAANRPPLLGKHRIATAPIRGLSSDLVEAVFAAKIRHELEHARQWNACGDEPFSLLHLANLVCARKTGGTVHGSFLSQLPIEDDANSAAAVFVRHIRPGSVERLVTNDVYGSLVRARVGPAPPETVVKRMTACLFHYRGILEDMAAENAGITVEDFLGMYSPNAVHTWTALCDAS
jgi:hypothetical protein